MSKRVYKNICVIEEDFGDVYTEGDCGCKSESCLSSAYGEGGDDQKQLTGEQITIKSYTLSNSNLMEVKLITWGASIVSIKCPDRHGALADVVLGFDDLKALANSRPVGYLDPKLNPFLGCALGRCANRIRDGVFTLKGNQYSLSKNDSAKKHHLHGGTNGFGRRIWESHVDESCCVVMSYLSEDGDEGYPGALLTTIKFRLTGDNRLEIGMRASTTKPTVVNLSHGSMFNLAGHCAGEEELRKHEISLNCDRWTVTDFHEEPVPIGTIRTVGGTVMDLRIPRLLGDIIDKVPGYIGFDHNFCVIRSSQPEVSFVARALHAPSGRFLEVYSDQPGVQLYTGGRLPPWAGDADSSCGASSTGEMPHGCAEDCDCVSEQAVEFLPGKQGARYGKFAGFGIQPQNYPDAVNIPHFPCAILRPGQVYYHDLVYKFGVQLDSSASCKSHANCH